MTPKKITPKRGRVGESISSRSLRVYFDAHPFTRPENFMWYEKLKGNNLIVKKSIHRMIDGEVTIQAEFDKFSWGEPLDIVGGYYSELVLQFYENKEDKEITEMDIICTFLKGVRIDVTSDFLSQLLNVPNDGPPVIYNQFDAIVFDPDYEIFQATRRLNY